MRDLRDPQPPLEADAERYGRERRALMLAGIARGLAGGVVSTSLLAPSLATRVSAVAPYVLLVGVLDALLDLPVAYVEGHVMERRYGMSTQSTAAWAADRAKASGITAVVLVPLLCAAVALARRFPRTWPLLATLASVPLLIAANLIVPTFIAPVFNRFEPLGGPLEARLRELASRYGVGDAAILRVDMSRQTRKANAYVTGLFGTHRIVVGDTLLEGFGDDAVTFVVAHELGHYVGRDTWIAVALGTVSIGTILTASHALVREADGSPATSLEHLHRLSVVAGMLGTLIGPLTASVSRAIERRADRFAINATSHPEWGVDAFTKLRERNLAEDEQPEWYELLFASHPSLRSRIEVLQAAIG